jgi:hypothetical protein
MRRYRWLFLTLAIYFTFLLAVCSSSPRNTTQDDNKTDIEEIEPQYRSIDYMSTDELKAELEKIKKQYQ